jgi:hypothetical protein
VKKKGKKTWAEKLNDSKDLPKVVRLEGKSAEKWGNVSMAIPAPIEVNELMKKVPSGKLITINELRKAIALKHKADIGCPITTGIFSWIAANAAEENKTQNNKDVIPYWRTLKLKGGVESQAKKLVKEGYEITHKKSKSFVKNFEKHLLSSEELVAGK